MSTTISWVISGISALASFLLTVSVRKYALARGILDKPNTRSSHESPVPRGGGLAFVVVFLIAIAILTAWEIVSRRTGIAIIGGGFLTAATGWIDDCRSLPVMHRLISHCAAAVWTVAWIGGVPPINFGLFVLDPGWLANLLGVLGIMWLINLYNFMDGIDGLAAFEAVSVGGCYVGLLWLGETTDITHLTLILVASVTGFLFWNWPPGTIFMGDVGSGFLGFAFGTLALVAAGQNRPLMWPLLILLSLFVMDSSVTLFRRLVTGQCWYKPHRDHAYQHAARRWGHGRVTAYAGAINVVLLLPVAYLSVRRPLLGFFLLLSTYALLGCAILASRAVRRD